MGSILVVEGAVLSKLNGGGVRSRIILSMLKGLGEVHVISIAKKPRHVNRIEKVESVASHSVVVANQSKFKTILYRAQEFISFGKNNVTLPANDVTLKIESLVNNNENIDLLVLRYINAWELSRLQGRQVLDRLCVWLDLDDRADKILFSKMKHSRFWLKRKMANRAFSTRTRALAQAANASDFCSLASEVDVAGFSIGANIIELANVVPTPDEQSNLRAPSLSQNIVFVGSYDWPLNVTAIAWFIDNCWPEITARFPDAKLNVVGTGKKSICDALKHKYYAANAVLWHWNVPELNSVYADCRMVISSVQHGSGSKIKVIEAAAYARPIVVSPHSQRGLGPSMTKTLKVGENANDFIAYCAEYLSQPEKADADGRALKNAQRRYHSKHTFANATYAALSKTETPPAIPKEVLANFSVASIQLNEVQK